MTPLERVEALYDSLLAHYGEGEDREIRASVKLLLVALDRLKRHAGPHWRQLVNEYLEIAKEYSTPKSSIFINGVLDKLTRDYKASGRLKKSGRGLL